MKKYFILFAIVVLAACNKSDKNNAVPTPSIVGVWNADSKDYDISAIEFTKDGRYFTWNQSGDAEIKTADNPLYKYDGTKLTTSFIDDYNANGTPNIAYDTIGCAVSDNKMTWDNSEHFTRQN